jgi:hypothetical protein
MSFDSELYNTQRNPLRISEYGRNVQEMVAYVKAVPDKSKRSLLAAGIINTMSNLNPHLREIADYRQKLWDHLFAIADFDLDVESPFPVPESRAMYRKPARIPYPDNLIRFRFYGRNVQNMLLRAAEMEDGETKSAFINLIASFMRNSCKNWNNENLSEEAIAEHMHMLSGGKLRLSPEDITILYHTRDFHRNGNNNGNGNGRNNNNRSNGNGNGRNNSKRNNRPGNNRNFRKKI